jgi:hypothetical protein
MKQLNQEYPATEALERQLRAMYQSPAQTERARRRIGRSLDPLNSSPVNVSGLSQEVERLSISFDFPVIEWRFSDEETALSNSDHYPTDALPTRNDCDNERNNKAEDSSPRMGVQIVGEGKKHMVRSPTVLCHLSLQKGMLARAKT